MDQPVSGNGAQVSLSSCYSPDDEISFRPQITVSVLPSQPVTGNADMLQFMQVLYYALRMTEAVEMPISKKTGKPCSHESHACFIQRFLSGKWLDKQ